MNIDNEILSYIHAMDEIRKQQARIILRALAISFPEKPRLSLVRPVRPAIGDRLGEGAQNY